MACGNEPPHLATGLPPPSPSVLNDIEANRSTPSNYDMRQGVVREKNPTLWLPDGQPLGRGVRGSRMLNFRLVNWVCEKAQTQVERTVAEFRRSKNLANAPARGFDRGMTGVGPVEKIILPYDNR